MREPRPTRRSWERRHRITALLRDAQQLAQQEATTDHEDRQAMAFMVRLGLLVEDSMDLEEKALALRSAHNRRTEE